MSFRGPESNNERYLRWLEDMWDVQPFDISGRAEREEARTKEVLDTFEELRELAKERSDPPEPPPNWESL